MKKAKISDILTVFISLAIIFTFGIAILIKPPKSFSETENRVLAQFPKANTDNIMNGKFFSRLGDFYSDQFPFRERFTTLKANSERFLLKQENNGIIFGKDGYLIARGDRNEDILHKNLAYLQELSKNNEICIFIAPRAIDVLSDKLPKLCDVSIEERTNTDIKAYLPSCITISNTIKNASKNGEYVWYKTDHHWTTDGAYLAYSSIAEKLDITPYSINEFYRVTVSDSFLGTSFSKSGIHSAESDSITLYRYDGDYEFCVYNEETGAETKGFYDLSRLEEKDKYLVFLGGNYSRIQIRAEDESRPTLLLIKDSFANSVIPFLARHFDLDVVDPRYFRGDVFSLINESNYDKTLILIGTGTLESTEMR
ncbi:MAG: hypothetical protein E7670_03850 [Ruminococcaceae bacterium]|nr:hypothetical protein [Oscillospiraceae bacterium]